MTNLAAERAHASRREAMQRQLFADLQAQQDPRMAGQGGVFDRYQFAGERDYYNRFMKGEKVKAGWVEESDYEKPDFDPERPLRTP